MPRRPNVVLIVLDTARARNLDLYGYPRDTMPRLRRWARRGVVFTRGFSTSCWTLPAHASLFTGLLPSRHGCHEAHLRLPGSVPTLAEILADAGYATAGFTSNAWVSTPFGLDRGFRHFFKDWQLIQSAHDVTNARWQAGHDAEAYSIPALVRRVTTTPARRFAVDVLNAVHARFLRRRYDYGARRINAAVRGWLRRLPRGVPYFLFVNYLEAHASYRPPRPFRDLFLPPGVSSRAALRTPHDRHRYNAGLVEQSPRELEIVRALYDAELRYLDTRLDALLRGLEARGDLDESLVVIVGDHGENLGEHHLFDHAYCLYDTVLHVPFVAFYPRGLPAGREAPALVQLTDILPTVLDLAGLPVPPGLDGRPLAEALGGPGRPFVRAELMGPQPRTEVVLRLVPEAAALRRFDRSLRAVRTAAHKLIAGSDGTVELYDLARDPDETRNVAGEQPGLVARLRALLPEPVVPPAAAADEIDEETRRALLDLGYLT